MVNIELNEVQVQIVIDRLMQSQSMIAKSDGVHGADKIRDRQEVIHVLRRYQESYPSVNDTKTKAQINREGALSVWESIIKNNTSVSEERLLTAQTFFREWHKELAARYKTSSEMTRLQMVLSAISTRLLKRKLVPKDDDAISVAANNLAQVVKTTKESCAALIQALESEKF